MYFLNNVASLESLEEGLRQLSPLADDALAVAEQMDEEDFSEFKRALSHERHIAQEGGESRMPIKYGPLLIPERFLVATPVAEKFAVGLGATCMRIMYFQRHGS